MVSDRQDIYMAHDQQQNIGRVQKGTLHANLDVLVLFMFFLMADLT